MNSVSPCIFEGLPLSTPSPDTELLLELACTISDSFRHIGTMTEATIGLSPSELPWDIHLLCGSSCQCCLFSGPRGSYKSGSGLCQAYLEREDKTTQGPFWGDLWSSLLPCVHSCGVLAGSIQCTTGYCSGVQNPRPGFLVLVEVSGPICPLTSLFLD